MLQLEKTSSSTKIQGVSVSWDRVKSSIRRLSSWLCLSAPPAPKQAAGTMSPCVPCTQDPKPHEQSREPHVQLPWAVPHTGTEQTPSDLHAQNQLEDKHLSSCGLQAGN